MVDPVATAALSGSRPRSQPFDDPLWFKDAIVYQLHVKAFKDSNGDGVGDFRGLTEKLGYIADLGVNTIWLLPFYPSPMKDDGYDVADYRSIHPAYGSRADFRRFVRQAHRRGIRVIIELVVNHTSDQHAWFQASRRAPRGSAKRNYYVWSDSDDRYAGTRVIFTDTETSNWTWDPLAQQYYWHRFFSHQPDLNFANPSVVRAVMRVMRFWLDMGVDGLRLDAVPYLCEREGTSNENLPETHAVLRQLRAMVDLHYQDRMLLAEANQWPEDVLEYFGAGDECHMAYHFPLMPRMFMAVAQEDRHPVVEILEQTPAIPPTCQWAVFLRNHDELTLEMVTDEERDYMYEAYARDPRARINVGIRRRLAPLVDNDAERIRLLTSMLLSMPGSPILYYGDELGMGDNIYLGDRNSVRTPMQWTFDRNAGFSAADPQQLYLPPVMDPVYGHEVVNVEAQSRQVTSMLNWTRRLIAVRNSTAAFGRGTLTMLAPGNRRVLAYVREQEDETILCVANLARAAQPVELDLSRFKGMVPVDMMGRSPFPPVGDLPYLLTLSGHGFFWFRLTREADVPDWHVEGLPRSDLVTLVLTGGWQSFFPEQLPPERRNVAANLTERFARRALPRFLEASRFVDPRGVRIASVDVQRQMLWETAAGAYLLVWARARLSGGVAQPCFLPLAIAWGRDQQPPVRELLPAAVARVRERGRMGVLYEAERDAGFCHMLLDGIRRCAELPVNAGLVRFLASAAAGDLLQSASPDTELRALQGEGANSVVRVGDGVVLKVLRHATAFPGAALSIGRYLTEHTSFGNCPRWLGAAVLDDEDGSAVLALAETFVSNQGDARRYLADHLQRFLDEVQLRPVEETRQIVDGVHAGSEALLRTLGARTGELHRALAPAEAPGPEFQPVPVDGDDVARWTAEVEGATALTLSRLAAAAEQLPALARDAVAEVLARRAALETRIGAARRARFAGFASRYHGDFHLGHVLVNGNDVVLTSFQDDPLLEPSHRLGRKHSPLRDVAAMLRSLDRVARSAMRVIGELPIGDPSLLRGFALDWLARAERAFLIGYAETTEGSGIYGPSFDQALPVVELFVLERVLHELRAGLDLGGQAVEGAAAALQRHLTEGFHPIDAR